MTTRPSTETERVQRWLRGTQGTDLTCRGYGNFNDDANTGFGTLRIAVLPVRGVHFTWWGHYFDLGIDMNAAGQFLAHGDSGTSCLITIPGGEQVVTGVQSTGYHGLDGRISNMISPETFRPWFSTFESLWTPAYQAQGSPPGGVASSPAVASMQHGRLDVFARGTDNAVWWSVRNGTALGPWTRIGPEAVSSDPAAISWGPGRMDVAARGTDGGYWLKSSNGSTWSGWGGLGGWFQTGPAIASRGPGLLDVFGRGGDNAVWMSSWNGSSWSGWSQIAPNVIDFKPAVIKSGPNQVDLFAVGFDSQMYTTRFNGTSWSAWTGLGGSFTSSPTVTSPLPGQLELYGRGQNGALWVNTFITSWSGWRQAQPAQISGDQASVSPPNSVRSDVVVRGNDNNVYVLETSGF